MEFLVDPKFMLKRWKLLLACSVLVVFLCTIKSLWTRMDLQTFLATINIMRGEAEGQPILYAVGAIILLHGMVLCCIPISLYIVGVGFVFKWWGILIAYPSTISACVLAFYVGKRTCLLFLQSRLKSNSELQTLKHVLKENPLKYCIMFRISPIPLFLKNYGLATLDVPLKPFFVACCISAIPWTLLEIAIGSSAYNVAEIWNSPNPTQYATKLVLLAVGVAALAGVVVLVSRAYLSKWEKIHSEVHYSTGVEEQDLAPNVGGKLHERKSFSEISIISNTPCLSAGNTKEPTTEFHGQCTNNRNTSSITDANSYLPVPFDVQATDGVIKYDEFGSTEIIRQRKKQLGTTTHIRDSQIKTNEAELHHIGSLTCEYPQNQPFSSSDSNGENADDDYFLEQKPGTSFCLSSAKK